MQEFGLTHTNLSLAYLHRHKMKVQATHANHSMYLLSWTTDFTLPTHPPCTGPFPRWVFPGNPEHWFPGQVLAAQLVLGGNSCVGYGQPLALKQLAWGSPRPRGDVRSRMPRLGAGGDGGMVAGLTWTGWMLLQHSHGKGVGIVLSR